jgi:C4-dicarboxylate-specific signal transduction histidine kinase
MLQQGSDGESAQSMNDFFETVFASLHGHVAVLNRDGRLIAVSRSWIEYSKNNGGKASATGVGANYLQVCDRATDGGDQEAAKSAAGIRGVLNGHLPRFVMDYECAEKWYQLTASPLVRRDGGAVVSHTDIGRLRLAELQADRLLTELSHVERVTLLGRFAAALAHELNQPLTAILANADVGELMLEGGDPHTAELQAIFSDIKSDSSRAANVISKLRVLLRKDTPALVAIDLNRLIEETSALARLHTALAGVPIRLRLAQALPSVRGDAVQIQQVLLNLIHNSAEAMQAVAPGERGLVVRTRTDEDSRIVVCVTDTGPGISAKDAEHIFDAFITNKPDGMGIGLHVSRSIVLAHGGRIWAHRRAGRGAQFCFSLPTDPGHS